MFARDLLGDKHPDTHLSAAHLGLALYSQGKTDGVRPFIKELIELKRQATLVQDVQAGPLNDYAWILLTCEPKDLRKRDGCSSRRRGSRAALWDARNGTCFIRLAWLRKQWTNRKSPLLRLRKLWH